ncbi:MAG: bacterial transcriptional activator domain-containing protein [Blautia marasmi]
MKLYEKAGQRNRADMVYRELQYILEQELDEVPGEEITKLWQRSSAKKGGACAGGKRLLQYGESQSDICKACWNGFMFYDRAEYRKLKYFSGLEDSLFVEGIESLCPRGDDTRGRGCWQDLLFISE